MLKKRLGHYLLASAAIAMLITALLINNQYFIKSSSVLASDMSSVNDRYTVKSGDSLFLIGRKYGVTVNKLKQANNLNSDLIMPGQVLVIPKGTSSGFSQYTVVKGDSLYLIAKKFNTTVDRLKKANALKSDLIMPGQVLKIPLGSSGSDSSSINMKPLKDALRDKGISPGARFSIVIEKSQHTLSLFSQGVWLKSYHVEFGDGGMGDKEIAGDHKTPEGTFYITEKSILNPADEYLGSRWMRLSYPNVEDANRGLNKGIIDQQTFNSISSAINSGQTPPQRTALGGGIGIHGGGVPEFGSNWTWGCIGLTNKDVEDFYDYMVVGTPVTIKK